MNNYRSSQFFLSVNNLAQLPDDNICEVAFAGRSNAGKSSAINVICDIKNLCRTSKTPGRTQMINYFQIDERDSRNYLVDLPGYGYAKVPLEVKHHWQSLLQEYLSTRESLQGVVIIMDVRRPMTEYDQIMMDWCKAAKMPTHVLLTKKDKLNAGAAKNILLKFKQMLKKDYPNCSAQLFSALKKQGADEVRDVLDGWIFA
ncbi:MAG: ribosome biogenesis GTP-binding protein YihA/YsxC [Pseudomonadota bacterium]